MDRAALAKHAEYAEYLMQLSKDRPSVLIDKTFEDGISNKSDSIHQKLLDMYVEEKGKQQDDQELDSATHLLDKLVKRDKLNCLILNLYPANEGYSLMIKARNGIETETIKLPYEESELLDYVDEAQLPPFLVDLLEKAHLNVFYSGCVIVEVRDYRRSATGSHDSQYVLLRPTQQSLLCDINAMMGESAHINTQEDEFMLESELLLATEEPLCLNPSPAVCLINNKIQFENKPLCTPDLKRIVKKYSQTAVNRKRKLAQAPAPKELKLFEFISKRKEKNRSTKSNNKTKPCVDFWKQKNAVNLSAPAVIEVDKYAKVLEKPPTGVEYPKIFVEEHTLEREPNQDKHMLARVTISRRSSDDTFYGELYLDYEYSQDKEDGGCCCQFLLGSRDEVDKYLEQFRQLFTEEGRRLVKITVKKPNLPPSTTYTQTPHGLNSNISIAQAFLKQATGLTATLSSSGQAESTGSNNLASKRNMPIQLSLSIAHSLVTQSNTVINQQSQISLPASSTLQATNQIGANSQPVSVIHGQSNQSAAPKLKQPILANTTRPSTIIKTPIVSPATTPTHQPAGYPGITVHQQASAAFQKSSSQTPPPNTVAAGIRKDQATTNSNITAVNLNAYLQGLVSSTAMSSTTTSQVTSSDTTIKNPQPQTVGTNINITNIGTLPANFNLQGLTALPGMNITNIQGLQNMQVSLTGVPGGAIAVPISMINTNPSIIHNQTGLFVSSLPNLSTSTSSSNQIQPSSTISTSQLTNPSVTSSAGILNMMTGLQTTSSPQLNTTTPSTSQVIMSTGLATSNPSTVLTSNLTSALASNTVLPQSSSMLSLPIGLAQYLPVTSKGQPGGPGIRATSSMPLLQLPGQQSIQLLNLPQQRTTSIKTSAGLGNIGRGQTIHGTTGTVLTNATGITPSSIGTISSLTTAKTAGQTITPQLMQFTSGGSIQPAPQLATQLTFHKQPSQQQLQFHHLQVKPGTPLTTHKPKVKKRTTPTPPNK